MDVTEKFCEILEQENINKSTLAKFMGKTKGYISQLLGGGRNLTLRSMADLAFHLGYEISIAFQKRKSYSKKEVFTLPWSKNQKNAVSLEDIYVADDYERIAGKFSQIAS